VDQMPMGLRPSLYVKDEDYRLSFLDGSYITMSRFTQDDIDRICRLFLSPLYISVHATGEKERTLLLGKKSTIPIMDILRQLSEKSISFHTQIVLCPGYNDNEVLIQSLRDLETLEDSLLSCSVVPVGLTRFRQGLPHLTIPDQEVADTTLEIIDRARERAFKKFGRRIFCASDELFLKLGLQVPPADYYEDYPQFENGVGMIRSFLDEADQCLKKFNAPAETSENLCSVIVSGASFAPVLEQWLTRNIPESISWKVLPVKNDFFGETVTVTGLLTFQDIQAQLASAQESGLIPEKRRTLIPDILLSRGDRLFLDGVTEDQAVDKLSCTFVAWEDPAALLRALGMIESSGSRRKASGSGKGESKK